MRFSQGSTLAVDAFVDPGCPWTWITSRWLKAVAPQRGLGIRWQSYSVEIRDNYEVGDTVPEEYREFAAAADRLSHRMLRIFESVRVGAGEGCIDQLYTEWGARFFADGASYDDHLVTECIRACGLDDHVMEAADDPSWDTEIQKAMDIAFIFGGRNTYTPTIVVDSHPKRGFHGPLMASVPDGEAGARLWDAIQVVFEKQTFFDIGRPRPPIPPQFVPRGIRLPQPNQCSLEDT